MKRTRNRRRCKSQHIDIGFDLFDFFFMRYAEALLFINDEQAEIFIDDVFRQEPVGSDYDVYRSVFQAFNRFIGLFSRSESAEKTDVNRIVLKTLHNGFIMLLREYCRRHKKRDLLSVCDRFKGRSDGYLRLPVSHITAKQTVHRALSFHILFNLLNGTELVLCFLIRESRFELPLHFMIGRERIAFACFPFRIKLNQIIGNILNGVFNFFLHPFPFTAAQFIKLRFFSFRADVLLHLIDLFYRDVQLIAALIMNVEVIFMNAFDF